jgi:hypothetical protein
LDVARPIASHSEMTVTVTMMWRERRRHPGAVGTNDRCKTADLGFKLTRERCVARGRIAELIRLRLRLLPPSVPCWCRRLKLPDSG